MEKIIYENRLENYPYLPFVLIKKDEFLFFGYFYNKESHFYSKAMDKFLTGFDYYKYAIMKEIERVTNIPIALIFHSEENKEFIFKQLSELPKPIIWQKSQCLEHEYMRHPLILNCIECRKQQKYTFEKCIHRKNKIRPIAVWDVDLFNRTTNFQISFFNKMDTHK